MSIVRLPHSIPAGVLRVVTIVGIVLAFAPAVPVWPEWLVISVGAVGVVLGCIGAQGQYRAGLAQRQEWIEADERTRAAAAADNRAAVKKAELDEKRRINQGKRRS